MQIDWITVAAQLVNFLLLAWLLKRFLYGPVIKAMAERERRIAERLTQADTREADAAAEAEGWRERSAALAAERESQLADARTAAEQERHTILDAARQEATADRERWQQDLVREQAEFRAALVHQLAGAAVEVAGLALADLADTTLQAQALRKLAQRVRELPPEALQALAEAALELQLASAFEPEPAALDALRQALAEVHGQPVEIECVNRPELLFGVELRGGGHKVDWSAAGRLEEVAAQVELPLDGAAQAEAASPGGGTPC